MRYCICAGFACGSAWVEVSDPLEHVRARSGCGSCIGIVICCVGASWFATGCARAGLYVCCMYCCGRRPGMICGSTCCWALSCCSCSCSCCCNNCSCNDGCCICSACCDCSNCICGIGCICCICCICCMAIGSGCCCMAIGCCICICCMAIGSG